MGVWGRSPQEFRISAYFAWKALGAISQVCASATFQTLCMFLGRSATTALSSLTALQSAGVSSRASTNKLPSFGAWGCNSFSKAISSTVYLAFKKNCTSIFALLDTDAPQLYRDCRTMARTTTDQAQPDSSCKDVKTTVVLTPIRIYLFVHNQGPNHISYIG